MRLRAILNREPPFPTTFKGAPVVAQFSSLGSIDEKWCASCLAEPVAACMLCVSVAELLLLDSQPWDWHHHPSQPAWMICAALPAHCIPAG